MGEPSTLVVLWRLAVTAFVIVTPTLMFIGLLRGLEILRDDVLINKYVDADDLDVEDTDELLEVLAEDTAIDSDAEPSMTGLRDDERTRCQHCGAPNERAATYCSECLEPID